MRRSNTASLDVRQQPQQALVTSEHKEKSTFDADETHLHILFKTKGFMLKRIIARKAVDPPPIVQLKVRDTHSADQGCVSMVDLKPCSRS